MDFKLRDLLMQSFHPYFRDQNGMIYFVFQLTIVSWILSNYWLKVISSVAFCPSRYRFMSLWIVTHLSSKDCSQKAGHGIWSRCFFGSNYAATVAFRGGMANIEEAWRLPTQEIVWEPARRKVCAPWSVLNLRLPSAKSRGRNFHLLWPVLAWDASSSRLTQNIIVKSLTVH